MIWKDVAGYEGYYQVSDAGFVRSLPRIDSLGRSRKGKVLKPHINPDGYGVVYPKVEGIKYKSYLIHRLVAQTFIPNPEGKPEVNHLKGKMDNSAEHLEWVTSKENKVHAFKEGRMNSKHRYKPVIAVGGIDLIEREFESKAAAALFFGIDQAALGKRIREEKPWKGITFYYKYLSEHCIRDPRGKVKTGYEDRPHGEDMGK